MSDSYEGRTSSHPDAELLLFAADEATAAQRAVVTEHLAGCAECAADCPTHAIAMVGAETSPAAPSVVQR